MVQLIKIEDNGTVNANKLHDKLYPQYKGNKPHTRKWFLRSMTNYYKEGEDYYIIKEITGKTNQITHVYYVTIDTAKELCMMSKSRIGRIIRKYFIHCEKQLRILDEHRYRKLQGAVYDLIEHTDRAKNGSLSIDAIYNQAVDAIEQLRILDEHRKHDTLCISDIACRFEDLTPWELSYQLHKDGYLIKRTMGTFPDPNFEHNNSIISVCDRYGKYYPRYTLKGVHMIEDYCIKKGYKFK